MYVTFDPEVTSGNLSYEYTCTHTNCSTVGDANRLGTVLMSFSGGLVNKSYAQNGILPSFLKHKVLHVLCEEVSRRELKKARNTSFFVK